MNSWRVILATMVIFGTGVVTGGLLVHHADRGRDRRPQRPANIARPGQITPAGIMRTEFLRRMERELDLTPEQREPIERILKDAQERTRKIMETVEPRRREEFKKTIDQFRAVLTPEQRERFDKLIKQQQHRTREQRKSAPGRRPMPTPPATNLPAATNA